MLQLILFFSLIATSTASCNRTCGKKTVPYPFGFSPSCSIPLSCNSTSGISFSGFPLQNFTANNTFLLNISANCTRPVTSASVFFSTNYALTHKNGLFLRNCAPSSTSPCLLPTMVVSQMSHQLSGCGPKGDNLTCFFNNTGNMYLTKDGVLNKSSCGDLFTTVVYEPLVAGQTVLALGIVEIGWWMTGKCHCAANASCTPVGSEVKDGYWCKCDEGFVGDGFADGDGCHREYQITKQMLRMEFPGIIASGILGAVLFLCIIYWRRYGKTCSNKYQITKQILLSEISCTLPIYSYREIERATNSFAETNKLGSGGYGTVYVGKLLLQNNSTDDLVAIKRIRYRADDSDSIDQLINEIKLISSVSHPNLVRLLGCCIDNGEQILIYEYMPNGTLSQHLHPDKGSSILSWSLRLSIATETAKAIAYLHNSIHPPIYHRDVKSSNILLDRDFNPKVADFGLSRAGRTELSHISTAPQGTPGYLDPEYHQNFHLSDKSDVYSFGVVLIEIITAMKVVDFSRGPTEVNLASLAVSRIGQGRIEEIVDPFLVKSSSRGDAWVMDSIKKVAELAFRCLAFSKDVRPGMSEVADELERVRATLPDSEPDLLDVEEDMGRNDEEKVLVTSSKTRRKRELKEDSPVSVQYMWVSENSSSSTNGSMPRFT
ncbi:wall-associated receptor kinase-like 14 [Carex littledalei]|uniref:Wall-associated receptor kinase-like 14 n=1 Tax=Carex littledalei TaxID=544730 RepID=A0A833RE26_9POAL|nr:wall-associated receptor kinase-like 14 [Carex littledalei]